MRWHPARSRVGRLLSGAAVLQLVVLSGVARAQTSSGVIVDSPDLASPGDPWSRRRTILTEHVDRAARWLPMRDWFGAAYAVGGAALLVFGAATWETDRPRAVAWVTGFGVTSAATFTSLFAGPDARSGVLQLVPPLNSGVLLLGLAVGETRFPAPKLTLGATAAGSFGVAILQGANLLARETPPSTLRRDSARLKTTEKLSSAELTELERDFMGSGDALDPWVVALPLGVSSIVALAPAFDHSYSKDDRTWSAIYGGIGLFAWLLGTISSDPTDVYRNALEVEGLELVAGPSEVSVQGRLP